MEGSTKNSSRVLNPWVLHLQKLALELKCPLCLNLLNRPLLLPCDHIFCDSCIPRSTKSNLDCPVCESQCPNADTRHLHFLENIVTIYKGLDSISGANLIQSVSSAVSWRTMDQFLSQEDNSSSGQSASANKLVQVLSKVSVGDGKSKGFEMPFIGGNVHKISNYPNLSKPSPHAQAGSIECGAAQINMNQVEKFSLESPPSFDETKGSDDESSDQDNEHGPPNYPCNGTMKRNSNEKTRQDNFGCSASRNVSHLRDFKRQKKVHSLPEYMGLPSTGDIQAMVLQGENLVTSSMESGHKVELASAVGTLPAINDNSCAVSYACGFCQSSRITEVTGPLLHYANGKQVVGNDTDHPSVIHVHSRCIDWAPQVYFAGETIKNLKPELARGAKLKCSGCGLKGAALGCYARSCRRSYHLPCAADISKCRWDYENYLMLCPAHCSFKFPKEKSRNCIQTVEITPQQSSVWTASSKKVKEWVLCGSALSSEEKLLLVRFAKMIGATVSKLWNPNVTHVVACTDENGACTRTLKVLMAITHGKWVLKLDWVKACMDAMCTVDEEPYEVSLDNHGCRNGPKTGRLAALEKAPRLFDGLGFYFCSDFVPGFKDDLQSLVNAAGGMIYEKREELEVLSSVDRGTSSGIYVVYNLDPPQGSMLGEEVTTLWQRLNEAEDLAYRTGSQVIGHTWLLESIAAHQLQPLVA